MTAHLAAFSAVLAAASSAPDGGNARAVAWLSLVALLLLPFLLPLLDAWWLARRSALAGAPIAPLQIVLMRLRRINPAVIVKAHTAATAAGLDLPLVKLQAHFMARGNVERTIQALCAAKAAALPLSFDRACAIELCGHDSTLAVAAAIIPHDIPFGDALPAAAGSISGTAGDGVRLTAGGTASVRCCLERLVGGAGEDTLRLRLGGAISAAIGAAADAQLLTAHPAALARTLLAAGLDAGTAFHLDALAITLQRSGPIAAPAVDVLPP